jgi:beta-lactamase class D
MKYKRILPIVILLSWLLNPVFCNENPDSNQKSFWPYSVPEHIVTTDNAKDYGFMLLHVNSGKTLAIGDKKRLSMRLSPCSTFKIPHSLIGLECGILTGPDQRFAWNGQKLAIKEWEREHSLHSAISYSVVPIFKDLAAKIGPDRMQQWLDRFNYGNCDISSGQSSFWLGESLTISIEEQIQFLAAMLAGQFPVASESIGTIQAATLQERFSDGRYHGKTGSDYRNGRWILGWWVGWLQKGEDGYVFAANICGEDNCSGMVARKLAEKTLKRLGLLSGTYEDRINLDFDKFDQDPEGGWRAVAAPGCELEAAKLLNDYLNVHSSKLQPWQTRILQFHAGQMQAFAGATAAALQHFRRSYDSYELNIKSPLRWNAYVRATIAFLDNDMAALKVCREALNKGPQDPAWVLPNQNVIDRLINGFGQLSYQEAYSGHTGQ